MEERNESTDAAGPVPIAGEVTGTAKEFGRRTYIIADVEPLDIDGVRTVEIGTALWFIAFLALLPFISSLRADGREWWLWTCMAGVGLGLFGIDHCRRRRRQRQK